MVDDSAIIGKRISVDDGNVITRTSITIESGKGTSLDILRPDGSFLVRINIDAWYDGSGRVDVVLDGKTQRGRFISWDKGIPQVNQVTAEGTVLHTVAILHKDDV